MSVPCPLWEAGGRRAVGGRVSFPDAADTEYCREKKDGVVVAVETRLGVGREDGGGGFVKRRLRDEETGTVAAELVEGSRRSGEGSVKVR